MGAETRPINFIGARYVERGMSPTAIAEKALLYSIWVGIFFLLLMPLVVTTQTIFPYIVGKAIYARVIIEILFGIWVVLAYISPSYR